MSDIISNLVAYWPLKMDQNDYSGNNYHGSNNGQIFENNYQKFNNSYIDMGDILNAELQSTNFTISQNFYQEQHEDSSGYNGFIIQKWNSSTYEDNSFILSPMRLSFNNPGSIYYPETYKLFKWYHYSFTYDNGTVKMYINGNLVQTHNNVMLGDSTGNPLRIGNLWNDHYNFIGRINNVRIYDRTLSEIDMSDLYNNDKYDINNIQMDSNKIYNIVYNNLTEPTHHILFKDYDGTVITGDYISDGGTQTPPPDPLRDGYTFSGWDVPLTNITEPTIFTAQYQLPEYTITFKDYDGTVIDTQIVTEGNSQTQPQNPTREGYTFSGWDKDFLNITSDLTINQTYIINTYTVTFKDYDGTIIDEQSVDYNTAQTQPQDPSREGYTFSGWDKSFNNVTSNLTVNQTYDINTYTVTFKDYDDSIIDTQTITYQNDQTQPQNPSREGYTFSGWDKSFSNITSDLTVNQTYDINTYTVTFKDYDGTILKEEEVDYNNQQSQPQDPTRIGYTFSGWDKDFSNITSDLTINQIYDTNSYTVTFKDYDGTLLDTQTVNYNNSQTQPQNPNRTGYTFTGWDKDFSNITSDLTVNQTYTINTYTLNIIENGNGTTTGQGNYNYNEEVTITQTPDTGYHFVNWSGDLSGNSLTSTITMDSNKNITQNFQINTYTVTFKDYNGTIIDEQTVEYNTAQIQPQNPSREGYTFSGWDKDFSNITSDLTINQTYSQLNNRLIELIMDKTKIVTAVMERTIFDVTFKDYDGTILKEESVNINNAQVQPQAPTRTGYTFTGWDKDFSNITTDLTVNQTYTINTYTVTININGNGTISGNGTYTHGDSVTIQQTPDIGYHFVNWTGDIQNNNLINTFTITEDKNITQNFQINTYNINITNDGNGSVNKTPNKTIYEYNEILQIEQIPNQNYEFDNWSGDLNTSNQTETLAITSDLNIQQNFKPVKKEIKVIIEPSDGGTVNGQGIYDYNSEFTLEQIPNDGYRFVGWKEGSCED